MTLALAMVLDALLGEPKWLWDRIPHPAVLIGRVIGWADAKFNTGDARRAKGIILIFCLVVSAWGLGAVLSLGGPVVDILVAAILLAQRSLSQHVTRVADALRLSTHDGRRVVAMIVGRDTATMTRPQVARAAIESTAENLSDGVIAPAFWFAVFGLPGMLAYKAINTADSMVGYLTPKHAEFGWAAAKLDDLVNWIPARLTALFALLATGRLGEIRSLGPDARLHRSPNAGWPEAAFARALGIALSGPRSYHGAQQDLPWVNGGARHDSGPDDIDAAVRLLWQSWGVALAATFLLALL